MPSSIEWINKRLTISAHPAKKAKKDNWWKDFDLIINLPD
jgi:hypothetical protein